MTNKLTVETLRSSLDTIEYLEYLMKCKDDEASIHSFIRRDGNPLNPPKRVRPNVIEASKRFCLFEIALCLKQLEELGVDTTEFMSEAPVEPEELPGDPELQEWELEELMDAAVEAGDEVALD